jgi:hypothetical protein
MSLFVSCLVSFRASQIVVSPLLTFVQATGHPTPILEAYVYGKDRRCQLRGSCPCQDDEPLVARQESSVHFIRFGRTPLLLSCYDTTR